MHRSLIRSALMVCFILTATVPVVMVYAATDKLISALVLNEAEAAALELKLLSIDDTSSHANFVTARYVDSYPSAHHKYFKTINFTVTLRPYEGSPDDAPDVIFQNKISGRTNCVSPNCQKREVRTGHFVPWRPCYSPYLNGYTDFGALGGETVFAQGDLLVEIESSTSYQALGGDPDPVELHKLAKRRHEWFVEQIAKKITSGYLADMMQLKAHAHVAKQTEKGFAWFGENIVVLEGTVTGPNGGMAGAVVEGFCYSPLGSGANYSIKTDSSGNFKSWVGTAKSVSSITVRVRHTSTQPAYAGTSTITLKDFNKTPPSAVTEEKERVETLHVQAAGYRPASFKVTLPASSNGWNVTGTITDGKTGIANAALRWDASSTITQADARGLFTKPFGTQSATPTVVRLDVRLDKSPPIKLDITEGNVIHTFLPFPIQGQDRTVQLVFTSDGANALADHRGTIKFLNAKQLPFITIDAQPRTLDSTGKWSVPVTVRKLEPSETFSLADIPINAEFEATIELPRWHTAIANAHFTVPLGAFVMMGSTVGPDYKKRYTPIAPEAITALHLAFPERVQAGQIRSLHLLGQVNSQGDFWTMIRAPEHGDSKEILLQWSDLYKVPLLLRACGRAGYTPDMIGKKHLVSFDRAQGNIDLLSPEEHEDRIRDLTMDFLNQMPLKSGARGDLAALIKNVKFSYDKATARPHWNGSAIVLPGDKRKLWGEEPYGRQARGESAIYVLAFHEMGHALHEFAVEKLGRIAWVRKLTYGAAAHDTWEPPAVSMPMPTIAAPGLSWKIRRKAVAFTEATAEFFAWCMYDHLDKAHADTFGKSLYFDRDYLSQFDTDTIALTACHHGGFQVEGVQATFLRALYTGLPAPLAYGDFLRTMALYQDEHFFLCWVPARAIDEWVAMKIKHGGPGGNVKALASRFNIIGGPAIFLQVAKDGGVCVNGKQMEMGSDKAQFLRLDIGDNVAVESGSFVVNFTATSSKQGVLDHIRIGAMSVKKGCEFEITGPFDVRLTKGKFASGGVDTTTPAGKVRHTKTTYIVEIGNDGATFLEVVDGSVEIDTAQGKTAVVAGNAVHIDRAGHARPAQSRNQRLLDTEFDPTASDTDDPVGTSTQSFVYRLDMKTPVVNPGDRIVVVHADALFIDPNAWIAFYKKAGDRNEDYISYTFLRNLTDRTYDVIAPDEPGGEYHFRLFATKGYDCMARSEPVEVK